MRVIPQRPPQSSDYNLPEVLKDVADLKNGIVLVTGPTGSGKSTTLAAIINQINQSRRTTSSPSRTPSSTCTGTSSRRSTSARSARTRKSFALALRAALRQAPKVILIGEMRDLETIETAMEAAETGHLVLSTLHTIDAAEDRRPHHRRLPQGPGGAGAHAASRSRSATSSRSACCPALTGGAASPPWKS